jgi:hypothetical protein
LVSWAKKLAASPPIQTGIDAAPIPVEALMDRQAPEPRDDGSRLAVTVEIGRGALVVLDDGDPPTLVIDTGRGQVVIEPSSMDTDVTVVLAELVAATEALRASVAARVLGRAANATP